MLWKLYDNEVHNLIEGFSEVAEKHKKLSIATGYWDLKLMPIVLPLISEYQEIRLLIGMDPTPGIRRPDGVRADFPDLEFANDLEALAYDPSLGESARMMISLMENGVLKVRKFTKSFLHAKCYIFGDFECGEPVGFVGSSNFTVNGFTDNTELNVVEKERMIVGAPIGGPEFGHLAWFEKMWNDDRSVDWSRDFQEIIKASPIHSNEVQPYASYIKALDYIYGEDVRRDHEGLESADPRLADFQSRNASSLIRKLDEFGVAMLADSVGLGKTVTAAAVINHYTRVTDDSIRVEVIRPASLRRQWSDDLRVFGVRGVVPITLENANEIAERRLRDSSKTVGLFVIDESHNLRNRDRVRYQEIEEWIADNSEARVLLLTATPINNSIMDLANQLILGARGNSEVLKFIRMDTSGQVIQDSFYDILQDVTKKVGQDLTRNGSIDTEYIRNAVSPIMQKLVVRRTRQGLIEEYGTLEIGGKNIRFPEAVNSVLKYTCGEVSASDGCVTLGGEVIGYHQLIDEIPNILKNTSTRLEHPLTRISNLEKSGSIVGGTSIITAMFALIASLGFAPYRFRIYRDDVYGQLRSSLTDLQRDAIGSQSGIYGILRVNLLKRAESSAASLQKSLADYQSYLGEFVDALEQGLVLDKSKKIPRIFDSESSDVDMQANLDEVQLSAVPDWLQVEDLIRDCRVDLSIVSELLLLCDNLLERDKKLELLVSRIAEIRKSAPSAKILVFSYFADTVEYLSTALPKHAGSPSDLNYEFVSSKRSIDLENIVGRFSPISQRYALSHGEVEIDCLVSTDVLSEGQNLQDAQFLINFDLHWNPVRMIQRNGRINRLFSAFDNVFVDSIVPTDDLEVFLGLVRKLEFKIDIIKSTIGTDSSVLDEAASPLQFVDAEIDLDGDLQQHDATSVIMGDEIFVEDLRKFLFSPEISDSARRKILALPQGTWSPVSVESSLDRDHILGLYGIKQADNAYTQFVRWSASTGKIKAYPHIQALQMLRCEIHTPPRSKSIDNLPRQDIHQKMTIGLESYFQSDEDSAPVGQERAVIDALVEQGLDIKSVPSIVRVFRSSNIQVKRRVERLKRKLVVVIRAKSWDSETALELVNLATRNDRVETRRDVVSTELTSLIYFGS